MDKPFQRKGAPSNAEVGRIFEQAALDFYKAKGLDLERDLKIAIGFETKKEHAFDLGSREEKIIVECKTYTWREGGEVPSAKMTTWDQAMLYFHLVPDEYQKIMFVLRDVRVTSGETLAAYYARLHGHLIPKDVEFWEYDEVAKTAERLK